MTARDDALAAVLHLEFAGLREQLAGPLDQFADGLRVRGARALDVSKRQMIWGGRGRLMGWTLRGINATVAVNLHDGRDNSGQLIGTVSVGLNSAWNQSSVWFGPGGVHFGEALFLDLIGTGTVSGAVYIVAD